MAKADAPVADMDEEVETLFNAAERLIFRNMNFIIAELVTTPELIKTFQTLGVFQPDQVAALHGCVGKHPDFSRPCLEVNEYLLDLAVQLDTRQVYAFLRSLERHQPEIPKLILKGQTVLELSSGYRGGGDVGDVAGSEKPDVNYGSNLEDALRKHGGRRREKVGEYLLRKGLISPPEEKKPYTVVKCHNITPDGGQYEFIDGTVHLSVPPGAVNAEAVKCTVDVSSTKGKNYLLQGHPVYVSQAFLIRVQDDLHFQCPVTVTVPKIRFGAGKKVILFRSNTPEGGFPDFQDVTAECSPTFSNRAVQFKVTHFSEYAFVILPLALFGIGVGAVAHILATRRVRLDVAAKRRGLKPGDDKIPMKLCVVDVDDDSARISQDGYELVSRSAPHIALQYNQYVDVKLAKYSGPVPVKASSCGEGGCWATTGRDGSSRQRLQRDSVHTFSLLQATVPRLTAGQCPIQDRDEGRPVLADGVFECNVSHYAWEQTSGPVSVRFIVAAAGGGGDEPMDESPASDVEDAGRQQANHVPCEFDHSDQAKLQVMRDSRKKALQDALDELVHNSSSNGVDAICDALVSKCEVLNIKEYEEIRDGGNSVEKMRRLILLVRTKRDSAFDCFVHAVEHRNYTKYVADNIRKYAGESL